MTFNIMTKAIGDLIGTVEQEKYSNLYKVVITYYGKITYQNTFSTLANAK